jgi:acyl-CoA synthetase (NDP forming)
MTTITDRARIIHALVHPRSVALVGASDNFAKLNGRPLKHLIEKGYKGAIYPINPKYMKIRHLDCYASIADLPEAPDLAIIAVPASDVIASIEALGRRGGKAAVIFSSGFGEMGEDGRALQEKLLATARAHGVLLCGPNCLGFCNAFDNVYATFSQYADGETGAGPIAFVTQSGAFGTAIAALVRQRGLGLGYFINTGNESDISFAELMEMVVADPRISVVAGYLEGVRDGEALVRLAQRCQALGKPLVLTKVGRKASGARAAASHTGALAVDDSVLDAILRQYGVLRARNEEQMLDMLEALCQPRAATGPGLGIVTQSGGAGVMMADRAEEMGLTVPQVSATTQARLAEVMPAFGAAGNPVDVTGQFLAEPAILRDSVIRLLEDPDIHVAIVWLQLMHAHTETLVKVFADIAANTTKPVIVCWVAATPEAVRRLRELGLIVYGAGERAVEGAAALHRFHTQRKAAALAQELDDVGPLAPGAQASVAATHLLQAAGIPMAPVALATTREEAIAHWRAFGKPVALKVESADILHKSDIGGVVLKLDDADAIGAAFANLMAIARRAVPEARIDGVLVQAMSSGHIELVMGAQRHPVFGMVVMVGFGGVLVEVLKDVVFRKAPFDRDTGLEMLAELRATRMLDGVRGAPAVDRGQIADMLARLSQWVYAARGSLEELDLNPVLVGADGPVAVDCVVIGAGS